MPIASDRCNACDGALAPRYASVLDPQTRETFAIHACTACGLGHTSPQPEDLSRYYGAAYHGGRHGFTESYCMARRMRLVEQTFPLGEGRKLLDIGCGDGTFMLSAQAKGWSVSGTEMNPDRARDAGLSVVQSLEQARSSGPFDCITLWQSLEHVRDPRATLTEAVRLLSPEGRVFVAVPDAQGLQARLFGARWFHLDVPRHLFHFGERSLSGLLAAVGLEVTATWHQELEIDLFGWTQSALNAVMPEPNVLFYRLTGRHVSAGSLQVAASFVLGAAVTAVALPAVPLGTATGKGGTLVMAAKRRDRFAERPA